VSSRWHDPRLSKKSLGKSLLGCELNLKQIWNPNLTIINKIKGTQKLHEDYATVDSNGYVTYDQRAQGDFSVHLNIKAFPFDRHLLPISILVFPYTRNEISFMIDKSVTGRRKNFTIAGWEIAKKVSTVISTEHIAPMKLRVPMVTFNLSAKREAGYYLWKIFLSLTLIVLMAWSVFWIDPDRLEAQVAISSATIITLIAFRFAFANLVPKVSYLTILDQFIIFSTMLVFLALGEAITTSVLAKKGRKTLAVRIDKWARWIYLFAYVVMITVTLGIGL